MTKEQAENIIKHHIDAIKNLDYSDTSYLDDFVESAHSPHTEAGFIERTRYVGMRHLPVNYVIVTGKDYGLQVTVEGDSIKFHWLKSSEQYAQQKVAAVEALVKLVSQ